MVVKSKDIETDYLTVVEMTCPEIETSRWKHVFTRLTADDPKYIKECTLAKTLTFEDADCAERFETSIRVMTFPFVNERAAVNT